MARNLFAAFLCVVLLGSARAATYDLIDNTTVIGDPLLATASDAGVKLRMADGTYQNVPWGKFSQKDLKEFAKNKKLTEFVEPFIEITAEEKAEMTKVVIKPVDRLSRPESGSVIGSLFGSGIGFLALLLVYAANVYAGFEIAIFRARNIWLVMGLAAIPFLGFISNIIWLSLPTYIEPVHEPTEEELAEMEANAPSYAVPLEGQHEAEAAAGGTTGAAAAPAEEVYAKGKFTFNRRFIETKFSSFFGAVRRGADKNHMLVFKTAKARLVADRITRITANDLHINVVEGGSGEVGLTFRDIQEIRVRK